MNIIQLRPKYQLEQYVVTFIFPGDITEIPDVSVEVVTGLDPDVQTFAGLLSVWQGDVNVLVRQGQPGCVYRITCSATVGDDVFEIAGVISVMPTSAELPPGSLPAPFTQVVTTPPYAYIYEEELDAIGVGLDGIYVEFLEDELDAFSLALDGILRELIARYTMEPEELDAVSVALNGVLRSLLLPYSMEPEELDVESVTMNGVLRNIVIPYLNYPPEEIDTVSIALNGTLA